MFAQVHSPKSLTPEELDRYLEQGWFRMGQTIFTTNFLNFEKQYFSAIWLRVGLDEFTSDKIQQKLFKLNEEFRTEFKEAIIDPAKEELYDQYKETISFEASSSLHHLLFGDTFHNVYNTFEVNIYDGAKLIATGIFDLGKNSAAGITSIYDPAYRKYSLGKYLIYLKMHYCKKLGIRYFYPGYFVPGYYSFDYKLAIGRPSLEYLELSSERWLPIDKFSMLQSPLTMMQKKLNHLQTLMTRAGVSTKVLKYEFFNVNLVPDLVGAELFDFPLLLYRDDEVGHIGHIMVYDVMSNQYHMYKCRSLWKSESIENANEFYASNLLITERDLFSTEFAAELVAFYKSSLI